MNKVVILTKGGKAGKGNQPEEQQRQAHMERVLKEWGVNKGLWLTEMRVKQKIDKIQPLKHLPLSGTANGKENGHEGENGNGHAAE